MAIYAVAIIFVSTYHEVWKDEVGVFSIIRSHPNFLDALRELKQYGHPFLWYSVLWLSYKVIHASVALKVAQIVIAVLSAWVLISKSPFTTFEKVLFLSGYFTLYEYAAISRNYGISMLLLLVVASLYSDRFNRMILYSLAVFFLAQTHVLSWIIALFLTLALIVESVPLRKCGDIDLKTFFISVVILLAGLALSLYTAYPGKTTIATHFFDTRFLSLAQAATKSFFQCFFVPQKIGDLFGIKNLWVLSGFFWAFYGLIFKRPALFAIFLASFLAFNFFFSTVYFGAMRHYGILYILFWAIFWMWRSEDNRENKAGDIRSQCLGLLVMVLSLPQIAMAYQAIEMEIKMDYSASKAASDLISKDPVLREAIIISEPSQHAEALPYYVNNRIYFPREGRFGTTTAMRKDVITKMKYSLNELLNDAQSLKQQYGKPILILLEPGLVGGDPGERQWAFGVSFSYSREALDRLLQSTKKVGGFYGTISGENYEMYLYD